MLFLPWKYISVEQVADLESTTDPVAVKQLLKDIFKLHYSDTRKCTISIDCFFYNWAFCKERGFDGIKSSTYLSLCNEMWLRDTGDSQTTRTSSFEYFQSELIKHAIDNSPKRYIVLCPVYPLLCDELLSIICLYIALKSLRKRKYPSF